MNDLSLSLQVKIDLAWAARKLDWLKMESALRQAIRERQSPEIFDEIVAAFTGRGHELDGE